MRFKCFQQLHSEIAAFSLKLALIMILMIAAITVSSAGWLELWNGFFETSQPEIQVIEFPAGVGAVPVNFKLKVSDTGAGLDEIIVRIAQRGKPREVYRKSLNRQKSEEISLQLSGEKDGLIEGAAELQIRAFDKTFWNNVNEVNIPFKIDYRKPQIQVLTTQHNIRKGGAQLIFYEVTDDNLNIHGVRVGNQTFLGIPARSLDGTFTNPNVFVALFAVSLNTPSDATLRVFAEDEVGNGSSASFYYKLIDSSVKPERIKINESFFTNQLPRLLSNNFDALKTWVTDEGGQFPTTREGLLTQDRTLLFKLVNKELRAISELELLKLLSQSQFRFERIWKGAFFMQEGAVRSAYGRMLAYDYRGEILGNSLQEGFEIISTRSNREITAANYGVVAFVAEAGIYGKVLGIDHGAGLFSIYAWLGNAIAHLGERVEPGQVIAQAGNEGFSQGGEYLFQLRVQGVPTTPQEWWDRSWYQSHITEKTNEVKRSLGLPFRQLELDDAR